MFTMYNVSLTNLERHLPASLPIELEIDATVLPNAWLRLCLAAMRNVDRSSTATAQLTVFVSNVDGYLKRADDVERCFEQCEEVIESACFLHSNQRVKNTMTGDRELSFGDVVRAAFAAVLTVDEAVDVENISRCLSSWQWVYEAKSSVQKSLYTMARL
jgi:hypothetical protein